MNKLTVWIAILVLKAARRAVLSTLNEAEADTYRAIQRQKLIDNGVNNV